MIKILPVTILIAHIFAASIQAQSDLWTYDDCVNYALRNNLELQQSMLSQKSGLFDIEAARAQWFPTLNFSSSHSVNNNPWPYSGQKSTAYTGNYGLNAGWTVYDGGLRSANIRKAELQNRVNQYSVDMVQNNLRIAILSQYMQILYAREAIKIAQEGAEVTKYQSYRAEKLMESGRLSSADAAQIAAQYQSDLYSVTSAQTNFNSALVELKQLLQLGISDEISLPELDFSEKDVLATVAPKATIYNDALSWIPSLKRAQVLKEIADTDIDIAKSSKRPQIGLNGGVSTATATGTGFSWASQMGHHFGEQLGLSFSLPIFDQKKASMAEAKARVSKLQADVDEELAATEVAQSVETTWLEASDAQAKYVSALAQMESAGKSDELVTRKFELGSANVLEVITSHQALLRARQELLQAKYLSILNLQLINYYRNLPIVLK